MSQYGQKLLDYIRSEQITASTAQDVLFDSRNSFDDMDSVVKAINELADEGIVSLNNDIAFGFKLI